MEKQAFIEAGRIINTHGVAGEVKIEVWLDSPSFMKKFKRLYIGGRETAVLSAREHKGFLLAKLDGVDDVNAAMALKGKTLLINREDVRLPKGAFFIQDIIGASVIDQSGAEIGRLSEVLETPAHRVYVVKGEREHLIPAIPEFVMSTDSEAGVIRVRLIEGM